MIYPHSSKSKLCFFFLFSFKSNVISCLINSVLHDEVSSGTHQNPQSIFQTPFFTRSHFSGFSFFLSVLCYCFIDVSLGLLPFTFNFVYQFNFHVATIPVMLRNFFFLGYRTITSFIFNILLCSDNFLF